MKPLAPGARAALAIAVLFVIGAATFVYYSHHMNSTVPVPGQPVSSTTDTEPAASDDTSQEPDTTDTAPTAALKDIANIDDFALASSTQAALERNGFAVAPGYAREFFSVYEDNRYRGVPSFITTDSLLHNYHLLFDDILKKLEQQKFLTELTKLTENMRVASAAHYDALRGTAWENAAKRNLYFFTVAKSILEPTSTLSSMPDVVRKEVNLIDQHAGIAVSPLMNFGETLDAKDAFKEDYSQYIPRGHYTSSNDLKKYFKAMMWYGRLTFRLKTDDETRSAILITLALSNDTIKKSWESIYEPTNFFVGKSDDITFYQYQTILTKAYGSKLTVKDLPSSTAAFNTFIAEAAKLDPPQINSIPVFAANIQPDRTREIKGFRFMGQRFTVDASIFQRLIDREVPGRMLPKGLDIPAAFGSDEAYRILTDLGETKNPKYVENMGKLKTHLAGLPTTTWTQNLYWGWLNALRPLIAKKDTSYPKFMQTTAWTRKDLNTFLGSWTELKHDTILYAKQVYAEMGGGGSEKKDDRGYVEPNVEVYNRLADLLKTTGEGLAKRNLLSPAMKDNLANMEKIARSLSAIAQKELKNQTLTDADYEFIRSYGGQLEHLWLDINKEAMAAQNLDQRNFLDQNPAALVADVATDPNGQVLEEAIGNINPIYVIITIDGKPRLAQGGVYSYYEFTHPLSDRLTDEAWRTMLNEQTAPAVPAWTNEFMGNP